MKTLKSTHDSEYPKMAPWIQTYTGRKAEPFDLKPEQVCIEDIAHALAQLCRFTGHCRHFYSVAEHSVRMSYIVEGKLLQLASLVHDGHEAYTNDVSSPIKWMVYVKRPPGAWDREYQAFGLIADAAQIVIMEALGLRHLVSFLASPELTRADLQMLATEKRDLMRVTPDKWIDLPEPLPERIEPWSPALAEEKFLQRWDWLTRS